MSPVARARPADDRPRTGIVQRCIRLAPYSELARNYDRALGRENFRQTRLAFETLIRRYGIPFRSAADIGCGTGLFARYLSHRWGVPVFAVDRSPAMLAIARENCRASPVCLLAQDIRVLQLPEPVDLITANFDVLNHLVRKADLRRALHRVARNLRPGGHLVFDAITNCRPLGSRRTFVRRVATPDGVLVQIIRWDPRRSLLRGMVVHRRRGPVPPRIERYVERGYGLHELMDALAAAHLPVRAMHDALTLESATRCSPRLWVIASKPVGAASTRASESHCG